MKSIPKVKVGDQFGFWTVKEIKNLCTIVCACKCGAERTWRQFDLLVRGVIKGCEKCYSPFSKGNDIKIGDKFGKWTIIDNELIRYKGVIKRNVQCECGKITTVRAHYLYNGESLSCTKCSKIDNYKGFKQLSLRYFNSVQRGAKSRGLSFNIDIQYVWSVLEKQKFKCALSGVEIGVSSYSRKSQDWFEQTASLDRIESDKGYEVGNIQWVHKEVNIMKMNLQEKDFINWCKLISKYNE